jgi:uncharacterized protein YndB with AHSA1/START domain
VKLVKKIAIAFVVVTALVLLGGFLLPSKWSVERAVNIKAAPEKVFPYLGTLNRWPEWTVWYEREPKTTVTYRGPVSGVGAKSAWRDKGGTGAITIVESVVPQKLRYDLSFNDGEFFMQGEFVLRPNGDYTAVTWTTFGDTGANPLSRYFALWMEPMMGKDFEQSLSKLKIKLEKNN